MPISIKSLLFIFILQPITYGCTDIVLISEDKNIIIGRTLDFAVIIPSSLYVFPKNMLFTTNSPDGNISKAWKNIYSFSSVGVYSEENEEQKKNSSNDFDGINEKGLSIEFLWHLEAEYGMPSEKEYSKSFLIGDISDYILGMCKNIQEASDFLKSHIFWFKEDSKLNGILPTVHLMITDLSGKSIVVEFKKGRAFIYNDTPGIMTNSPSYGWHLENLRNYVGKTNQDTPFKIINQRMVKSTSHGTGMHGVPGDFTSPSRFIKSCLMKDFIKPKNLQDSMSAIHYMIGNVSIPLNVVIEEQKDRIINDYTQWSIIKNLNEKIIYIKLYDQLNYKMINMESLWNKNAYICIKIEDL